MSLSRVSVNHPVAVHLLMWAVVVVGGYWSVNLVREMFPNSDPEKVSITAPYPGALPVEIEKSVTRQIERELEEVDDIEKMESTVTEGLSLTTLTVEHGGDIDRLLSDVRAAMDRVEPDLPAGIENVSINLVRPFFPVIGVIVHGDTSEIRLHEEALRIRDELLDLKSVTKVAMTGIRDREVHVEVLPSLLDAHGLTFEEVGQALRAANLDAPGGQLKGERGDISVRTQAEVQDASSIEAFVLRGDDDGALLTLRDIGDVKEGFEDKLEFGRVAGDRAVQLTIFKTPDQDALEIAAEVKAFIASRPTRGGGAIELETTNDLSRFVQQRLDLMLRNAKWGILLVLLTLAIFLDLRVAFWVGVGLPISFLGTFILMHYLGATINLISLFGLIVVLGLIVDDAIVIGENVFAKMREGMPAKQAAIEGATEVSIPVLAAITTTIVAFLPLAFIDGDVGAFMRQLPLVVMSALSVSLIEAFVILPCHLAARKNDSSAAPTSGVRSVLKRLGEWKLRLVEEHLANVYERALRLVLRWRYAFVAVVLGFSIAVVGFVVGGIVPFIFLQESDAETIVIDLEMESGTPVELTQAMVDRIEAIIGVEPEIKQTVATIGAAFGDRGRISVAEPATIGQINVELHSAEEREDMALRTSTDLLTAIRSSCEGLNGVNKLTFTARSGGAGGPPIEAHVRAPDLTSLSLAVDVVQEELHRFAGVVDVQHNLRRGKMEVQLELLDGAQDLGVSTRRLAMEVRHALFGFEVQRLQTEQEEKRVRVLLPPDSRRDIRDLARLMIKTPSGERVPLQEIARLKMGRGLATLGRVNGHRAATITANVEESVANLSEVTAALSEALADIGKRIPGASVNFEGRKKETRDSMASLQTGFPLALFLIYSIIAILFRSYTQPLLIMGTIPFSIIGAILGHFVTGYPFTLLSMIGSVALAGIVVNDSLILVDFVNRWRRKGMPIRDAVVAGGRARLRPILLTSITTISGLAPLMLERSFQAKFLVPMAISIVYGLAFATILTLFLVPSLYRIGDDMHRLIHGSGDEGDKFQPQS